MIKFTDVIFDTLTEEVKNKKLFNTLMNNWRTENPAITDEEGEEMLNIFSRIKDNLRPDLPQVYTFLNRFDGEHGHSKFDENNLKDITKYTYRQIKFLTDEYSTNPTERAQDVFAGESTAPTPERVEASKNLWFGKDNLLFEKDGLRVYDIKNQQMSVRYGYWYHVVYKNAKENIDSSQRYNDPWCVTWRPDMGRTNMWGTYRPTRSFYFVIDDNKPQTDKYYISAVQRVPQEHVGFIINSIFNEEDKRVTWNEIERIYPQLVGQRDLFKEREYSREELTFQDVVGQITERPGSQYEFKRVEKQLKKAYLDNGGVLTKSESWKAMDTSLRNLYILYPQMNQYNVKQRFGNFEFVNEIRKVGNEYKLLDNTLKQKGIKDGVGFIFDFLMGSEFKVARVSIDNKNIRLYESKSSGKSGLYDIRKNDWVELDGVRYEPLFHEIDTDIYNDEEGNTYVVEIFSKSATPEDSSFYSVYEIGEANPDLDSHFMSSRKWRELQKELSPEDGSESNSTNPKDYADIKEKRGY